MVTKKWNNVIGKKRIKVIECLDNGNQRVWIKFVPRDKSKMEVCHILDQKEKVSWEFKNSHFETIDENNKTIGRYPATSAGSVRLDAGTTNIQKEMGSKVLVFPIDMRGSLTPLNYSEAGTQFQIETNKPLWMGYVVSGKGSISPSS